MLFYQVPRCGKCCWSGNPTLRTTLEHCVPLVKIVCILFSGWPLIDLMAFTNIAHRPGLPVWFGILGERGANANIGFSPGPAHDIESLSQSVCTLYLCSCSSALISKPSAFLYRFHPSPLWLLSCHLCGPALLIPSHWNSDFSKLY